MTQHHLSDFDKKSDKQALLDAVAERIKTEMVCPLKDMAKNLVFGKGNPNAAIMVLGEAAGAREDELGMPFVGKAGQQLDRCLKKINLSLDDVYIANILKYRPPQNRNPTSEEMQRHTPYLIEQIKIIQPNFPEIKRFKSKSKSGALRRRKIDRISVKKNRIQIQQNKYKREVFHN